MAKGKSHTTVGELLEILHELPKSFTVRSLVFCCDFSFESWKAPTVPDLISELEMIGKGHVLQSFKIDFEAKDGWPHSIKFRYDESKDFCEDNRIDFDQMFLDSGHGEDEPVRKKLDLMRFVSSEVDDQENIERYVF